MAKNKGFRRRDAAQKQRAIDTGITMHQLVGQVDLDALILTLAYGECMGNDRWGRERIERFCLEWRQNTAYVYRGLDPEDPEADAVRADVDKRLFAKTTEDDRTPRTAWWWTWGSSGGRWMSSETMTVCFNGTCPFEDCSHHPGQLKGMPRDDTVTRNWWRR